jgi:hypothetical protein
VRTWYKTQISKLGAEMEKLAPNLKASDRLSEV